MEFETAFVVKALKNGYRLAEIPVEVHPRIFYVNKKRWTIGLFRLIRAILAAARQDRE